MSARATAVAVLGAVLAGCSSNAASPVAPTVPAKQSASRIVAQMHVIVPFGRAGREHRRGLVHQRFVSASTKGIEVVVYPSVSSSARAATVRADVAAGSPDCSSAGSGRACTISLPPLPPNAPLLFAVACYDQPPSGSAFPAGTHALGYGTAVVTLVPGKANVVGVTVGGIVARVTMSAPAAIHAITPSVQTLSVQALDADGNTIVSDAFVDSRGNPIEISMSADANAGAAVTFSPPSFSAPPAAGVRLSYAPANATAAQLENGFSSLLSATPSNGVPGATATLAAAAPVITEFSVPTASAFTNDENLPTGLTPGPDGAIWFSEGTSSKIGRITTTGTITEFPTSLPNSSPQYLAAGSDGALWFALNATGQIGRIPVNATPGSSAQIATFGVPSPLASPRSLTSGPGGALWYTATGTSSTNILQMTTKGVVENSYEIATDNVDPDQMVETPDNALWFTELRSPLTKGSEPDRLGRITAQGAYTYIDLPTYGSAVFGITAGPDQAVWFAEFANDAIGRAPLNATMTSQIAEYPVPTSASGPAGITVGPDGALWFTEYFSGKIGRVPTNATPGSGAQIVEFTLPNASAAPSSIVTGPDGAIWFVEVSANKIGRLQ